MTAGLQKVWLVKVRATLGPEPPDDKEESILNRVVRWMEDCLLYEADPRRVEKLLRDAGLEDCKALTTPGVKEPTSSVKAWFEGEDAPHGETVGDASRILPIGASSNGSPYLER